MSREQQPRDDRTREQRLRDREELAAQGAGASAAAELAANQMSPQRKAALLEELTDPDIFDGKDEALGDIFGPDFSRSHVLGQKDEEDVWRDRWLNENEADRVIHEHNPGRLCFGPFLELAQGVHDIDTEPQREMTDSAKRKVRTALDAKTAYQTMGKDGKTFRGVTEIVTTNKVERDGDVEESDGRLSKIRNKLFG